MTTMIATTTTTTTTTTMVMMTVMTMMMSETGIATPHDGSILGFWSGGEKRWCLASSQRPKFWVSFLGSQHALLFCSFACLLELI